MVNVISGSEAENPFYSFIMPKLFIQTKMSQKSLKMFVNRQRLAIGYNSPLKDALLRTPWPPHRLRRVTGTG